MLFLYLSYYQGLPQLPSARKERNQLLDVPGGDAVRDGVIVVLSHQLVGSPEVNTSSTKQSGYIVFAANESWK